MSVDVKVFNRTIHTRKGYARANLPIIVGKPKVAIGGVVLQDRLNGSFKGEPTNQGVWILVSSIDGTGGTTTQTFTVEQALTGEPPAWVDHSGMTFDQLITKELNVTLRPGGGTLQANLLTDLKIVPERSGPSCRTYRSFNRLDKQYWFELTVEMFNAMPYARFILDWGTQTRKSPERHWPREDLVLSSSGFNYGLLRNKSSNLMDTTSQLPAEQLIADGAGNRVRGVIAFATVDALELTTIAAEMLSPLEAIADGRGHRYGVWPAVQTSVGSEATYRAAILGFRNKNFSGGGVPTTVTLASAWWQAFWINWPAMSQGGPHGSYGAQVFGRDARLFLPEQMDFIQWCTDQEVCRPHNYRDPDSTVGAMESYEKRPDFRDQPTTYQKAAMGFGIPATGQMGKAGGGPYTRFARWQGWFPTHCNANALVEYDQFTDDVGSARTVEQWVEMALYGSPIDPAISQYGSKITEPRGVGWTIYTMAQLHRRTGDDRLVKWARYRVDQTLKEAVQRRFPSSPGVIEGHASAGPKFHSTAWQSHIEAMGLFAAFEQFCWEDALIRGIAIVDEYAKFWQGSPGRQWMPWAVESPPGSGQPGPLVVNGQRISASDGGTSYYCLGALDYARKTNKLTTASQAICDAVVASWTGGAQFNNSHDRWRIY